MNASTKAQTETTTGSILAEIGPFAKHETATRNHVRTLAERIETGLATAIEALASAGAAPRAEQRHLRRRARARERRGVGKPRLDKGQERRERR